MSAAKLTLGQKLWLAPAHSRRGAYEVEVTKIGRRWAELSGNNGRVDMETLWLDGGEYSSPGRCWLSREEYEDYRAADIAWNALFYQQHRSRPPSVTAAAIREAGRSLGH